MNQIEDIKAIIDRHEKSVDYNPYDLPEAIVAYYQTRMQEARSEGLKSLKRRLQGMAIEHGERGLDLLFSEVTALCDELILSTFKAPSSEGDGEFVTVKKDTKWIYAGHRLKVLSKRPEGRFEEGYGSQYKLCLKGTEFEKKYPTSPYTFIYEMDLILEPLTNK